MEQLETLKRQIASATDLHSLVKIMKTLAAVRVREYGQVAETLENYDKTIRMGLQVLMKNRPREINVPGSSFDRTGLIILGSDQGLSGRFNEIVSDYAVARMNETEPIREKRALLVVGERAAFYLEKTQPDIKDVLPFIGDIFGVEQIIPKVLLQIEKWNAERSADRVVLVYNRPESEASFYPRTQLLLPVDPAWLFGLAEANWPCRTLPTFTMDWNQLFSSLVKQHLFFSLYRALVESLASENISRLMAMQVADSNIEERLNEFGVVYNRIRQVSITSELLDIVTGYEALKETDKST